MKGVISTDGTSMEELQNQLDVYPGMVNRDLATDVATQDVLLQMNHKIHDFVSMLLMVAVRKTSFVFSQRLFCSCGTDSCFVEEWQRDCDLVFLSNGLGDPASLQEPIQK